MRAAAQKSAKSTPQTKEISAVPAVVFPSQSGKLRYRAITRPRLEAATRPPWPRTAAQTAAQSSIGDPKRPSTRVTVPARGVVGARGRRKRRPWGRPTDADGRPPPCARPKQAHPRASGGGHLRRGRRARTWGPQMGSAACGRRRAAVWRRRQISALGRGGPDPHPRKTRQIGCNQPLRRRMRSRRRREAAESGAYLAAGLHTRPKRGPQTPTWP